MEDTNELVSPQPMPKKNDGEDIWELVKKDIHYRQLKGIETYNTPLQAFNGRDPLIDAYQEALDLVVYLRQAIEEKRIEKRTPR